MEKSPTLKTKWQKWQFYPLKIAYTDPSSRIINQFETHVPNPSSQFRFLIFNPRTQPKPLRLKTNPDLDYMYASTPPSTSPSSASPTTPPSPTTASLSLNLESACDFANKCQQIVEPTTMWKPPIVARATKLCLIQDWDFEGLTNSFLSLPLIYR